MKKFPADEIVQKPAKALVPYARNARTHSDEQVAQIAASIREWGWTTPILIDESDNVIAGHGRLLAARQLGMDTVPCVVASGWTEAQRKAYVLADNKLALNAGWDNEFLKLELQGLAEFDFDMSLTGFSDDEIAALTAFCNEGLTDPDETPEVQERVVTVPGDRWLLGNHRVKCGDSTSEDDVASLLAGVEPHLMVTDPPYGVNYDPSWRGKALRDGAARAEGLVSNDDRADWREAWALFPGDVAYVWHAATRSHEVVESLAVVGFEVRAQIIWAKNRQTLSRGHYHPQHEPCWYAVRKSGNGHWAGDRKQTTLWQIEHRKSETGHGTQKPVEAMRRPIVNNSSPGQAVYDPFLGSGTTLIAGEMEGRHVYGMELSPAYVDVIIRRWQEFTGKDAVLDCPESMWTFTEIEANRKAA